MAVKSQENIDAGAGLALAGSRKKGDELATSATGTNIAGTDICEEFGHPGSDQTAVGSNINIGSYHTGDGGLVPAGTANVAASASATKRFQHYVGTANTSIDSTFALPNLNFTQNIFTGANIFSQAFAYVYFSRDTANNRIRVTYGSGTSANYALQYNTYIYYVNLGSATWTARYNVVSQAVGNDAANASCHGSYTQGPTPVYDGYNSGTFYTIPTAGYLTFWWLAQANPNSPPCGSLANVLGSFDYQTRVGGSGLAPFEVKAVSGGTPYVSRADFSDPLIRTSISLIASTNGTPNFL